MLLLNFLNFYDIEKMPYKSKVSEKQKKWDLLQGVYREPIEDAHEEELKHGYEKVSVPKKIKFYMNTFGREYVVKLATCRLFDLCYFVSRDNVFHNGHVYVVTKLIEAAYDVSMGITYDSTNRTVNLDDTKGNITASISLDIADTCITEIEAYFDLLPVKV